MDKTLEQQSTINPTQASYTQQPGTFWNNDLN